jgi:hypothetical protein
MNKLFTRSFNIALLVLIPFLGFSQESDSVATKDNPKKNRSAYIGITTGIGFSNFRDFATSPLIYHGIPKYISASFIRANKFRETEFRISGSMGAYAISVGNETTSSATSFFNLYYSRLYRMNKISNDKWNIKLGGTYKLTGDLRSNPSLQNNSTGLEFFSTFFASVKVTNDISRKVSKNKKFLWIKYQVNPRKRSLSYHFNLGVVNSTFRNGYSYNGQAGVLNKTGLFDGYEMHLFSGFRLSSEFDYTIYLKNKNAIQLSYIWDAAKTGGDLDKFEIAHHVFKITFLFNTNNK